MVWYRTWFLISSLAFGAMLAGCGDGLDTGIDMPSFDVPAEADRTKFLENFPLLNSASQEGSQAADTGGTSPFGAFVYMPLQGKGHYCSSTHLKKGELFTNAHCVEDDSDTSNYFVIFYNKSGEKRVYRTGKFLFHGQ